MSDKGWIKCGELWGKLASDGTLLVWHSSMGGNKHTNHCHVSSDFATCNFPNYKPSRLALQALKEELDEHNS